MTSHEKTSSTSVMQTWENITTLFKTRSAFRPHKYWQMGLTSRLDINRLSLLRKTKQARKLDNILSDLPNRDVKALRTFAAINQEQSTAGFRVTMVTNITVPVGFLAILHQLSPNGLGALLFSFYERELLFMGVLGIIIATLVIGIALFALATLSQARDIRNLIDLHAAERGIYFGLEDMEELTLT